MYYFLYRAMSLLPFLGGSSLLLEILLKIFLVTVSLFKTFKYLIYIDFILE